MLKNLCRSYDVELNDLEADWAATIALTREGCFGVWRSVLDFETTGEPVFTYVNVLASRDKAACLQLLSTLNEDDFLVVAPEVES